ncbi:UDP-N-acetylglucosamine 1-carboxyvinyltransferase [Candidatus Nesciobacter abundans]|uniref:UDP-N-acetylglucosamine 1-carboxyvinyltransferase n=1 Tax=Candidatus Nesciobacter abundans TaxID=2601668 RepID=A0A5C0UHH5_9PROT|nr:UDP-N-acetylglucosamine 1-carboxyvinyltransferase [Candidatus Nesciobacter abundans]QEK39177.1 UDP-N-acetylglucosamine 1-carboxyvinyltransferase [Candidatus Nesciobacter abundans]
MNFCQITGSKNIGGKITCSGSKNFSTKAIIASMLSDQTSFFENVPEIGDIDSLKTLIEDCGGSLIIKNNKAEVIPGKSKSIIKARDNVMYGRLSILFLAVLIHKFDYVEVPNQDGCDFSGRPLNFHEKISEKFGFKLGSKDCSFFAEKSKKLEGQDIKLDFPSVGATEFAIFLAVMAKGFSTIENIAIEPEIKSLITMLQNMGAKIHYLKTRKLFVEGVEELCGIKTEMIGDRVEASSWAVLAACTDSVIEVENINPEHMSGFLGIFRRMGGGFELEKNSIKFFKKEKLHNILVQTDTYPGFSTDYQAMLSVMMTQSEGMGIIHETLFKYRLHHLETLKLFGANTYSSVHCVGDVCRFKDQNYLHSGFIVGPTKLTAPKKTVFAENLRSGMAYVLAACISEGTTSIGNMDFVYRGYSDLYNKLKSVNVNVKLIDNEVI